MSAERLDLPRLCVTSAHLDSLRVSNHLGEPLVGKYACDGMPDTCWNSEFSISLLLFVVVAASRISYSATYHLQRTRPISLPYAADERSNSTTIAIW